MRHGRKTAAGREPTSGSRPPTMMDVAAAAGVSQTTVSLVLNNIVEARLSASTRNRVRDAARVLGYTLPGHAPARVAGVGATAVGFVADEITTDPWCAMQLEAVRAKAWEHGLTVTAGVSHGDPELEAAILERMLAEPLVGLIYASVLTRPIRPLEAFGRTPTVLLNCYVPDHSLASVVPGELLGGYVATLHLIRAGHRRIAHVHGQSWTDPARDRIRGYRRALAEHDILYDPALVRPGNWEPPTGYAAHGGADGPARPADGDLPLERHDGGRRLRRPAGSAGCAFRRTCRWSATTTARSPSSCARR